MKPLKWDSKDEHGNAYRWDSPNVTWSGILEPGDPGYIPPDLPPASVFNPNLKKKMKRQAYYPTAAAAQILWLGNFRHKLPGYTAQLQLTAGELATGDIQPLIVSYYVGSWLPVKREAGKSATAAVYAVQYGDPNTPITMPLFTPPDLPAELAALPNLGNNGALDRLFALIQTIKSRPGYTEAIGLDLGIVGAGETAPDLATLQPDFTATVNGPKVEIDWGWGGYAAFLDQIEIQVDRGSGWTMLTIDTTPGYTDSAPHPAALTKWKYRAIYRVDDDQVGLWSNEVSVTVGG